MRTLFFFFSFFSFWDENKKTTRRKKEEEGGQQGVMHRRKNGRSARNTEEEVDLAEFEAGWARKGAATDDDEDDDDEDGELVEDKRYGDEDLLDDDYSSVLREEKVEFLNENTRKITINNEDALEARREAILLKIDGERNVPWYETLVLTASKPLEVDAKDDLNRELAL